MEAKALGQEHGATVRKAATYSVSLVVALGKDVVLNVRRGGGYLGGFVEGLTGSRNSIPNA